MNLDDLKNFKIDMESLKKISVDDIRAFINQKQVLALNIAIALASVITISFVLNKTFQEYGSLQGALKVLEAKEEPIDNYDRSLKKNNAFLQKVLPALGEDEMISFITDIASRRHISIDSFDVPRTLMKGFYRETMVTLSCSAPSFRDVMLFVHDIEHSGFWVSVGSLALKAQASSDQKNVQKNDQKNPSGVMISIGVFTIELMGNELKKQKKQ